eukprot:CAMPEP_0177791764 /NCGR_PEP_ID=MMETSP0491_2-20121128/24123_1 /TAXON_ID=63592 /ORGANISM="Tetraselmis chuii, Strain PLY429" /LENGTH=409 /DNA_ID=CAMNT_0019314049 /DNA_START=224 /DNA_END=1455 /DNA_ORIENTATION=-
MSSSSQHRANAGQQDGSTHSYGENAVSKLVAAGNAAYVDEDYSGAVDSYTAALEVPGLPACAAAEVYALRAQAHTQREDYVNGVADANRAVDLNPKLQKAYLRKGVACFRLDEYEAAKSAFVAGMAISEAQEPFKTWIRKCDAELQEEEEAEELTLPSGAPPAQEHEAAKSTPAAAAEPLRPPAAAPSPVPPAVEPAATDPTEAPPTASTSAPAPNSKYRHQWYQTANAVSLSVMANEAGAAEVKITARTVSVHIKAPDSEEFEYALDLNLAGTVDADASKVEYLSTKIEIRLPKADSTGNWPALEATAAEQAAAAAATAVKPVEAKDWDQIEQEVEEEEKDEKLEGDAALQKLFRQIYSGADEDTRRAMNKSFVESNGTVLSTNWNEIGQKKVECTPPGGMEVKKYEM